MPTQGKLVLDGWIRLDAAARIATLVDALKARVRALLLQKLESPGLDISATAEVQGLLKVLMSDGMA